MTILHCSTSVSVIGLKMIDIVMLFCIFHWGFYNFFFFFTLFRISSTFLPKFLPAQSKELHTIDRQEEKNNRKRKSLTIFSMKERDRDIVSQINVETASKATIEKRLRDEVERTAFPDHVDIILN